MMQISMASGIVVFNQYQCLLYIILYISIMCIISVILVISWIQRPLTPASVLFM